MAAALQNGLQYPGYGQRATPRTIGVGDYTAPIAGNYLGVQAGAPPNPPPAAQFPATAGATYRTLGNAFGQADLNALLPQRVVGAHDAPGTGTFNLAAQARDFFRPSWSKGGVILGPLRKERGEGPPASLAVKQRIADTLKAKRKAKAQEFQAPQYDPLRRARSVVNAYQRDQKEQAKRNRLYFSRQHLQPATMNQAYLEREKAMKAIARDLPGSITKPELVADLTRLEGTRMTEQDYTQMGLTAGLAGYNWRNLPAEVKKSAAARFVELIGMLNLKPKYDARLTSEASAQTVFNPTDYIIGTYDLDNNILTPGCVVVMTRNAITDRKGNVTPAGTIVAVDGWVLRPETQAQHVQKLKEMIFYGSHPTKSRRAVIDRKLWNLANFGNPKELKPAKDNLAWFAKLIKNYLKTNLHAVLPDTAQHDFGTPQASRIYTRRLPTLLGLTCRMEEVTGAIFKLAAPAFNTLISRAAELLFNMCIAPMIYNASDPNALPAPGAGEPAPQISDTVLVFRKCYDQSGHGGTPQYDNQTTLMTTIQQQGDPEGFQSMVNLAVGADATNLGNMYLMWHHSYYHPLALAAFFRDDFFCALFRQAVELFFQAPPTIVIQAALHQIMFFTMNSDLPSFMDDAMRQPATLGEMNQYYALMPQIFVYNDQRMASAIQQNLFDSLPSVSSKNWDTDVRAQQHITLRGKSFVPQAAARNARLQQLTDGFGTYADYYPAIVPAGTAPRNVSFYRGHEFPAQEEEEVEEEAPQLPPGAGPMILEPPTPALQTVGAGGM